MNRSEINEKYKWRVEDIYETEELWEKDFAKVKELLSSISEYEGKLALSSENLANCLKIDEQISLLLEKLNVYATLKQDEDTRNTYYQGLNDRIDSLYTQVGTKTSFIVPEIIEMDESTLFQYVDENEKLKSYKLMIKWILRDKEHMLSAEQEMLLSQVSPLSSFPSNTFNMLNNADIQFDTIQNEHGETVPLTKGNYSEFLESHDQLVRKQAYDTLYKAYKSQKNTISSILQGNIKKNVVFSRVRKYPSVLERALFSDDVPVEVYNNLISSVKKNIEPMKKYLKTRKKLMNLPVLHMYDLYVSLIENVEQKYPFEEAYRLVQEGLAPLGKEYINVLEEALQNRWMDVFENEGKRGGAYQWGAYGTHPFVLLNHKDNLDSVFTIAHEMGHAMHSYYSDSANDYTYAQYTIFVAEVASTVNEVLLMHHLLGQTKDKNTKLYLLNHFLDKFRGTLFRQTMFAEFEKIVHERAEQDLPLTVDEFSDIYKELLDVYFGGEVELDDNIIYEWMRIPHFYTSFYVYKYATGFSAAIAIAKRILEEGETALNEYLNFLHSGGTDFPIELLKIAGVDMSTVKPVEDALVYFSELVDELEALSNK